MQVFKPIPQLVFLLMAMAIESSAEDTTHTWNFDNDSPATLPSEFIVGTLFDGKTAGEWKVLDRAQSPPHVLGQLMGKGAEHAYKTVLINGIMASDLELQVSFLPIEGKAYPIWEVV